MAVAVDLALPRDLEPAEGVELIDLQTLRGLARGNRAARRSAARDAEELVMRKLDTLTHRYSQHRVAAAIADLRLESNSVFERELARLLGGPVVELGGLDERAKQALERWAREAFGRVAHVPISAMKQLAEELAGDPGGHAARTEPDRIEEREV